MIKVMSEDIPVEATLNSLRDPDCGAVMSYLGTVRSYLDGKQSMGLSFEVEDSIMQESLQKVESEALHKFEVKQISIVHRTGSFAVGDEILFIAISAGHRGPAFDACRYLIDRIKELHAVWKREKLRDF